jgi:hypothetical protein
VVSLSEYGTTTLWRAIFGNEKNAAAFLDAALLCFFEKLMQRYEQELFHFPGIAGAQELAQVAGTSLRDDSLNLLIHHVFVARHVIPRAEDSDGRGEIRAMLHVRELEGIGRPGMVNIMNDQIGLGDAVSELHDFDVTIRFPSDTLVAVLAENHRLAMFELEDVLAAGIAVGQ